MKNTLFSCFSDKEVVNCRDGKLLGCPTDLKFDTDSGQLISFFVRESGRFSVSSKNRAAEIPWDKITKIGDDIILVDIEFFPHGGEQKQKKDKKYFFGG